jgi:DNA adenine methylase
VTKLKYKKNEVFFYLDPPFYLKADRLYRHYFHEQQHKELRDAVLKLKHPWLLSYDNAKPIRTYYMSNGTAPKKLGFLYSAAIQDERNETEELILTNLTKLPSETRLWRTTAEWHSPPRKST